MPKVSKISKKRLRKYYVELKDMVYYNDINPKEYENRIYLMKKRPLAKGNEPEIWIKKETIEYLYVMVHEKFVFPNVLATLDKTKIQMKEKPFKRYGAKINAVVYRIPIKVLQRNYKGNLFRSAEGYDMIEVSLALWTHGKNKNCKVDVNYGE